ncbi:MAG: chemotaxis protein CheD [Caulobacteraceae bacterium]
MTHLARSVDMVERSVRGPRIAVLQGHYEVTGNPETVLSTVLGSCVAACLWDASARVGGMNHFLLPNARAGERSDTLRYGVHAMELLVNALLNAGARRSALEAKLFGGAQITEGFSDAGRLNAEFATDFLDREGIVFRGGSLGGRVARRVEFWAVSGRARQRAVVDGDGVFDGERRGQPRLPVEAGDVQLFGR